MGNPSTSGSDLVVVDGSAGEDDDADVRGPAERTDDAATVNEDLETDLPSSKRPERFDPYTLIGSKVGRYVVLDVIGSGGMGFVCTAFDPKLDRKVALKLLKTPTDATRHRLSRARGRMIREAQALAKLSHPNIIVVHDVDSWEQRLYIAMEYVEGCDLQQWLEGGTRPWRDVLDLFIRAGRGLEAAHEAGITHRDFKPSNVLVGNDGRIRVLDFGLAKSFESDGSSRMDDDSDRVDVDAADHETAKAETDSDIMAVVGSASAMKLTQAGRLLGTPAYMAPEAHGGDHEVGPWTDQFSFCVALYESLYGRVPFKGEYLHDVLKECVAGRIREPRETSVPGWVLRVLRRGLAYSPDDRYPSMQGLLTALSNDPAKKRRRALQIGGLVGLVGLATFGLFKAFDEEAPCQGAEERVAETWDDARRNEIADALRATKTPYASDTADRVVAALDAYAAKWAEQRTLICEATHVHKEQSETLLDHRMQCLDEQFGQLSAVLGVLAEADEKVVLRATSAVTGLGSPTRCASAQPAGEDPLPDEPKARAKVADIRASLDRARALHDFAARYSDAATLLELAVEEAQKVDHKPTLAEALLMLGRAQVELGRLEDGEKNLEKAARSASAAGAVTTEIKCWIELVFTSGVRRGEKSRAEAWAAAGMAALERTPTRELLEVELLFHIGGTQTQLNELEDAADTLQRALALAEQQRPDSPLIAKLHANLGIVSAKLGRLDEAESHLRSAYSSTQALLGNSHPELARTALSLGNVYLVKERSDDNLRQAKRYYDEALEIRRRVFGAESVPVAQVHVALSKVASVQEKLREAEDELRLAAVSFRKDAANASQLAVVLNNLGMLATKRGDVDGALEAHEEALRTLLDAEGEESPLVARTRHLMCLTHSERGEHDAAREQCAAAVQALPDKPGREKAKALKTWALVEHAAGNGRTSAELAARALEAYGPDGKLPPETRRQLERIASEN